MITRDSQHNQVREDQQKSKTDFLLFNTVSIIVNQFGPVIFTRPTAWPLTFISAYGFWPILWIDPWWYNYILVIFSIVSTNVSRRGVLKLCQAGTQKRNLVSPQDPNVTCIMYYQK